MQPNANPNPNLTPNPNLPSRPEQPVQPGLEQAPAAPEMAPRAPQGAPTSQPVSLPQIPNVSSPQLPNVADPNAAAAPVAVPVGANPAVAGDADVIEKEWVDQADQIIKQTQNDPYLEEEAVESLQIDYLKKRYNHDVQKPGDKDPGDQVTSQQAQ